MAEGQRICWPPGQNSFLMGQDAALADHSHRSGDEPRQKLEGLLLGHGANIGGLYSNVVDTLLDALICPDLSRAFVAAGSFETGQTVGFSIGFPHGGVLREGLMACHSTGTLGLICLLSLPGGGCSGVAIESPEARGALGLSRKCSRATMRAVTSCGGGGTRRCCGHWLSPHGDC